MGNFEKVLNTYATDRGKARRMALRRLEKLDRRMARVTEGLVDILILKGLVSEKDFPVEVRRLMAERHSLRTIVQQQ